MIQTLDAGPRRDRARARHAGFTLVEMLVTLGIVGVLIALIIPALGVVRNRAQDAAAFNDIEQLSIAVNKFQTEKGVFPPSRMHLLESQKYSRGSEFDRFSVEYLGKIFPNMRIHWSQGNSGGTLVASDRYLWCDDKANGKDPATPGSWDGRYSLEGDETLVFFLGGISSFQRDSSTRGKVPDSPPVQLHGFSADPKNPSRVPNPQVAGSEQRTPKYFDFEGGRLFVRAVGSDGGNLPYVNDTATPASSDWSIDPNDRVADKLPSYRDTFSTSDEPRPYAYFSSYEGRGYRPWDCAIPNPFNSTEELRLGYFQLLYPNVTSQEGGDSAQSHASNILGPNPYTSSETAPSASSGSKAASAVQSLERTRFQIIAPGRDHMYGRGGQLGVNKDLRATGDDSNSGENQYDFDSDNISTVGRGKTIGAFNHDLMQNR